MPLASNFTAFSHRFHIQFRINLASNFTTSRSGARRIFSVEHRAPDIGRTPGTGHQAPAPGTGHRAPDSGRRAPGTGQRAPGTGRRELGTGRAAAAPHDTEGRQDTLCFGQT